MALATVILNVMTAAAAGHIQLVFLVPDQVIVTVGLIGVAVGAEVFAGPGSLGIGRVGRGMAV